MRNAWTDKEVLTALHLRDHEGLTAVLIGTRLSRSKSSVLGTLNRIDHANAEHDQSGVQNGTMPAAWWKQ